jgi:hypothetical protein
MALLPPQKSPTSRADPDGTASTPSSMPFLDSNNKSVFSSAQEQQIKIENGVEANITKPDDLEELGVAPIARWGCLTESGVCFLLSSRQLQKPCNLLTTSTHK